METRTSRMTNPLAWIGGIAVILIGGIAVILIGGIAVILFCGAGFAAVMGWIPTSVDPPADRHPLLVAQAAPVPARCAECGVIEATRAVDVKDEGTGIGAVGGMLVGNEIENHMMTTRSFEVTVRMEDGSSRIFQEAGAPAWRNGERVKVIAGAIRAI